MKNFKMAHLNKILFLRSLLLNKFSIDPRKLLLFAISMLIFNIAWGQHSDKSININSDSEIQPYLSFECPNLDIKENGVSVEFFVLTKPNSFPGFYPEDSDNYPKKDMLIIDNEGGTVRTFEALIQFVFNPDTQNSTLALGVLTDVMQPTEPPYEMKKYLALMGCDEINILRILDDRHWSSPMEVVHQVMAVLHNDGMLSVYLDGVEESYNMNWNSCSGRTSMLSQINIGGGIDVVSTTGSIDELSVWNKAMESDYVKESFDEFEGTSKYVNAINDYYSYEFKFNVTNEKNYFKTYGQDINARDLIEDQEKMIGYFRFNDLSPTSENLTNSIESNESLRLVNNTSQDQSIIGKGLFLPYAIKDQYIQAVDDEDVVYLIEYVSDPDGSDERYGLKFLAKEFGSSYPKLYKLEENNKKTVTPVPIFPIMLEGLNPPEGANFEEGELPAFLIFTGKTETGDVLNWSENSGVTISPVLFDYNPPNNNLHTIEGYFHESQIFFISGNEDYFEFRPYSRVNEGLRYNRTTGEFETISSVDSEHTVTSKWKLLPQNLIYDSHSGKVEWNFRKGFNNDVNEIKTLNAGDFIWVDNFNKDFFLDEVGLEEDQIVMNLEGYDIEIEKGEYEGLIIPTYVQMQEITNASGIEERTYYNFLHLQGVFRDEFNEIGISLNSNRLFVPEENILYLRSGNKNYLNEGTCPHPVRAVLYAEDNPSKKLESIELSRDKEQLNYFSYHILENGVPENQTLWIRVESENENTLCNATIISISAK